MSFSVGIVGLPNVGKSTLFKALTKQQVKIAPRPFTTIQPNHGIVAVPDKRLEKIAKIINPEKTTPTIIEFVDIAGLVKEAHKGEGLGNQFLAQIRNCDAICEIVRVFKNQSIEHIEGSVDPERDIEIVKTELLMKDLETLEKILIKLKNKKEKHNQKKLRLIAKIKQQIAEGKQISEIVLNLEEKSEIKELRLLTEKPVLYILNTSAENIEFKKENLSALKLNLKLEEEILDLSEKEIEELRMTSLLYRLILACYQILDLITFYTITGGKETRAWTLKKGLTAEQAAGIVHSDFQDKFIRAEVINWEELVKTGSWKNAREKGGLKIVGRDYAVADGDVIEFKI